MDASKAAPNIKQNRLAQEEEAAAEKADACLDCINLLHFRVNITAAPFMIYYNVF